MFRGALGAPVVNVLVLAGGDKGCRIDMFDFKQMTLLFKRF